ncbi:MAG TPA: PIN domain-containing protein [Thermoanaerobaculia bacterium]|nr:PIN domain-containing protein [Thermoanaerobaculia bacterium]
MTFILIDTTVASALHRGSETPPFGDRTPVVSFQTVAELWLWAEQNRWGDARRDRLEAFIRSVVVLPYDVELARVWARVMAHTRSIGRRLEDGDGWVAASAIHHHIPLVTHDHDFDGWQIPDLEVVLVS